MNLAHHLLLSARRLPGQPAVIERDRVEHTYAVLARRTGGRLLSLADLEGFSRDLPSRQAPVSEAWFLPLWHKAWVFLCARACFVAEWGLRRWRGLP